jgi:hypothetical protein
VVFTLWLIETRDSGANAPCETKRGDMRRGGGAHSHHQHHIIHTSTQKISSNITICDSTVILVHGTSMGPSERWGDSVGGLSTLV